MKGFLAQLKRVAALSPTLLLTPALCALVASARQSPSGSLRGEVADALGGLVVGATVTLTDSRGAEKTATTDRAGAYLISGLAPGTYTVRASARGFVVAEIAGVKIAAGRAEVLDIKLSAALERQEATVTSGSTMSTDPANNMNAMVLRGVASSSLICVGVMSG